MPDVARRVLPQYLLPATVVFATLIALIVLPLVMSSRTNRLRDQIERRVEPARSQLNEVSYQLGIQISSLHRSAVTLDQQYLDDYREAGVARDRAMATLAKDVHLLGSDVVEQFGQLQKVIRRWQGSVERYLAVRSSEEAEAPVLASQEARYAAVIDAVKELDQAMSRFQSQYRLKARRLVRLQVVISVLLVLLATSAACVVLWLVGRLRNLASRLAEESTERMSLLEKEREARETAEFLVKTRDEILGIVSHDLRSPLTTISLSTQLLIESPPEEVAKLVETIKSSTLRMERLIQDLLDVVKLENSSLSIERQPVNPTAVAKEAFVSHVPIAAEKGVDLRQEIQEPLPEIFGDRDRILQVLANLLGNALKFTPGGGQVSLSVRAQDSSVLFEVADSGPGIPEGDLPRIFDPFWQAKKTAHLGAGLGLKIARGIVEAHGGAIWASNLPDGGAAFSFVLPQASAHLRDEATRPSPILPFAPGPAG